MQQAGAIDQGGDAFKWTRDFLNEPLIPLPEIHNPIKENLDSGLDHLVKAALDSTGMMNVLEKVTGNLSHLTGVAQEWQSQAKAMHELADELRHGGADLAGSWAGQAANSFGTHMGELVEAIDGTARDMDQTAQIISQAAAACKLAEDMTVEIIREAIEALIVSLAAMVIVDIVTVGLATIVDALVADAEIEVFILRVGKVSEELATKLRELMKAVKEIRSAEKGFRKALTAAKDLKKLGSIGNRGKAIGDLLRNPSLDTLRNFGEAQVAHELTTGVAKDVVGLITGGGDPVGTAKKNLVKDPFVNGVTDQLDHDFGGKQDAPAYRVPKSRIEEAFG